MATPVTTFRVQASDLADMKSIGWDCCDRKPVAAAVMERTEYEHGEKITYEVLRKVCASCASTYARMNGDDWVIYPVKEQEIAVTVLHDDGSISETTMLVAEDQPTFIAALVGLPDHITRDDIREMKIRLLR